MILKLLACCALPLSLAMADFQYQSTSRMTGGSLLQMMRFVPGGGAMKDPQVSTIALQGNRYVRKGPHQAEIVDLDKRTIVRINFDKHTWSEITFEQMKQQLEQMSQQMQQSSAQKPDVNLSMDADIKQTGQTRTVNGYEAHEAVMTFSMQGTDPKSGGSGAMKIASHMWLATAVPGYSQVREFYARMAKELDWAPTGLGGMMNRPDIARAMAKMVAEGGSIDGTPVEQVMRMSAEMAGTGTEQPQSPDSSAAPQRPSTSDSLAGALGGKLGGFGGFGKRKKQDSAQPQDASAEPSQPGDNALMEMTIDNTGFSSSPVDSSLFEIPAGYKKVEEDHSGRPGKK